MRTALVLLFLLALAAVPGSVLPQRSVSVEAVRQWYRDHPDLAPTVDRLGGFDVYSSPWFSAIYLLLFTSLVGCVVPRLRDHLRALRGAPVDAPRRLSRLPQHATGLRHDAPPAEAGAALHAALRSKRWRSVVRSHADGTVTVSAEKGYLKETGNLLMHTAMVAVLVGVALGAWYGWHGNRLVVAGPDHRFCNVLQQYDEYGLGSRVDGTALPPFCFELTDFDAEYTETGQPLSFQARGEVAEAGGAPRPVEFTVNSPLRLDRANLYLLGHGYAAVLRYTDRYGQTQTAVAPFLPIDNLGTAEGVAAFPDANVDPERPAERDRSLQVAFEGLYLPTAPADAPVLIRSEHPEEQSPLLMLFAYRGDLGIDSGAATSLWQLNPAQIAAGELAMVGEPTFLRPGESMTLDDGTTVEFVGTQRWITVSVRYDPGEPVVLTGAGLLLVGLVLSLTGRRRRVWFRLRPGDDNHSDIEAAGLPRSDYAGFPDEFADLLRKLPVSEAPVPVPVARSS
ncbi:MAG TPA: cytochrome c biogenesis protein ResB [Natronosporangium sp.]